MKQSNPISWLFAAAGALLAVLTVVLSLACLNADPILVTVPEDAEQRASALMIALSRGEYDEAEKMLYGNPNLGVDREAADEVGILIWDAFVSSIDYEFSGDFYATDSGIARNVSITALELASVTENLGQRSQALLERRVANAEDVSQVYDENNDYREDFVMNVLYDAAYQSLQEDARYVSREVTLNLVYRQGKWWVMPSQELLSAISGGTAG